LTSVTDFVTKFEVFADFLHVYQKMNRSNVHHAHARRSGVSNQDVMPVKTGIQKSILVSLLRRA